MAKKKALPTVTVATDKKKALDQALAQIEKQHGKNAVMFLGQEVEQEDKDVISTGSIGLDMALGIGGLPRGRIIEIYGPESSGKTTLALHAIASAQADGGIAAFIDAEHALDPSYAAALGVDVDSLLVAGVIAKSKCVAIFINQLREKVGVMYGNPEVTTGGRALKFYSSVRIDVRRVEYLKDGDRAIGSHTRAKIVKNKMAPPFREAYFDIMYGEGISRTGELLDLGVDYELIKKGGAWFTINEERFQGRDNAKKYLAEHPEVADALEAQIREAIQENREKAKQERQAHAAQRRTAKPSAGEDEQQTPEEAPQRRSAAVSIDADDFGDDDI